MKNKKGITNNYRAAFFGQFNESILKKIQELKGTKTVLNNHRTPIDLERDFSEKCNEQRLSKTEVLNTHKANFTYNVLTARGAVMIIAKKNSILSNAAKLSLDKEEDFLEFIEFIKDQCKNGNRTSLIKNHSSDVIGAILNYK